MYCKIFRGSHYTEMLVMT